MTGTMSAWLGGVTLPIVAIGVAMGLLLAAAWHDLRARLIPDEICISLAVLGGGFRLQVGLIDFAFSAIGSLLLFFLLFAAFNRGVVGGGDVKLIVAVGLWLSPPDCYVFLVTTALAGGVLAMVHILVRMTSGGTRDPDARANVECPGNSASPEVGGVRKSPLFQVSAERVSLTELARAELERIRSGCPLPYGVAIAVGGCYTLLLSLGG